MRFFIMAGSDFYPNPTFDTIVTCEYRSQVEAEVGRMRAGLDVDYITVFDLAPEEGGGIRRYRMSTNKHPERGMWQEIE